MVVRSQSVAIDGILVRLVVGQARKRRNRALVQAEMPPRFGGQIIVGFAERANAEFFRLRFFRQNREKGFS